MGYFRYELHVCEAGWVGGVFIPTHSPLQIFFLGSATDMKVAFF